jgi:hypothetical protein
VQRARRALERQLAKKSITGRDARDRRDGIVVLDEKVTDAGRFRSGEDAREIDFPASDVGNLPLAVHVLDVDEWKASWVSIKIFDRVLPAFGDPVEIQL